MAERFKAAVLKTVERKLRGFESLSLRHVNDSMQGTQFRVPSMKKRQAAGIHSARCTLYCVSCTAVRGEVAERLKAAAC
jgi:hypothetical protein